MTTREQRVCRVCGKAHYGRFEDCSGCLKRVVRSKYVGTKGCRICGGRSNRKGGVCRTCFWATYKQIEKKLSERNRLVKDFEIPERWK